ncbi:hypothetical protein, partial [Escherichia coli]|uniref:hypothetical protein n=1 Tax=Escherichia coli TaxID=562 RepID=UPI001BCA404B
ADDSATALLFPVLFVDVLAGDSDLHCDGYLDVDGAEFREASRCGGGDVLGPAPQATRCHGGLRAVGE